jgi:Zn-dependent protease
LSQIKACSVVRGPHRIWQTFFRRPPIFKYRLRLFSLFGFDVWIDASWLLLAALITWTLAAAVFPRITPNLSPVSYWWMAAAATIGLLFSIVFHETAHALVARRYGVPIGGITLFIFGGVAQMEQEPTTPKSELLMAAAGPLASILLSATFFALLAGAQAWSLPPAIRGMVWYLGFINGMLAIFNLVPAFPLDGGRVLRAALWLWRGDLTWATRIATGAGNLFGIALIVFGVFDIVTGDIIGGIWQFLIGMFLRGAAEMSYQQTIARTALHAVPVLRVMNREPISVAPDLSIAEFIEEFVYRRHHRSFPVTRQGMLVGSVGTEQAAMVEQSAWPTTSVGEIMLPFKADDVIEPDADALAALTRMRRTGRSRLWVVQEGRLVGVLSLRDMLELLSARLELEEGLHHRRWTLRR